MNVSEPPWGSVAVRYYSTSTRRAEFKPQTLYNVFESRNMPTALILSALVCFCMGCQDGFLSLHAQEIKKKHSQRFRAASPVPGDSRSDILQLDAKKCWNGSSVLDSESGGHTRAQAPVCCVHGVHERL